MTLKVTAKLKPGWHIYTQAKTQEGDGPRKTIFDLFDPAGLEVAGDWKASQQAGVEGGARLREPGLRVLRGRGHLEHPAQGSRRHARRQEGDPPPGQLPDLQRPELQLPGPLDAPEPATLTVAGGGTGRGAGGQARGPEAASLTRRLPGQEGQLAADPAQGRHAHPVGRSRRGPSRRDRDLQGDGEAGAGPAHLRGRQGRTRSADGPIPTTFDFFDPAGLKLAGTWKPDRAARSARPSRPSNNQLIEYFENEVTWSITLAVPADATPGKRTLRCQAGYQICNERSCFPPGQWTLPDVALNIVAGAAPAAAPPSQPLGAARGSRRRLPRPVKPATPAPAPPHPAGAARSSARAARGHSSPSAAPVSEIARRAQEGLIPFLFASALGGLFALVMPCVWPMVPITVNFFVKQGQTARAKETTTGLAITYCLAIIGIFTAVGVFFSFFFSASFLQNLANNPWLNLVVAALFLAFGLSLLGLFEIRLPNFLLNASAQGESRGGLIGVIFMALTLTITSFTCTFPVVGGLLVMAAGGNFLYPIVGLATFATVLALPFFLLALSPGLLSKMPRSGDWMNTVKVVGGLVEIGAAFKFLNTAELGYVTPENAWFDAQVVLTAWIVLSAVCGFYLLGFFRTDHDHDEVQGRARPDGLRLALPGTGPLPDPRPLRPAAAEPGLGPAGRGHPAARCVGVQPAGGRRWRRQPADGAPAAAEVKASSTDPAQAEREEKKVHGVLWGMSLEQAKELAAAAEEADPDRLHRRQLRQLPADGAARPAQAARSSSCSRSSSRSSSTPTACRSARSRAAQREGAGREEPGASA